MIEELWKTKKGKLLRLTQLDSKDIFIEPAKNQRKNTSRQIAIINSSQLADLNISGELLFIRTIQH